MEQKEISVIIQGYDVPKERADRWAGFAAIYCELAHVIGWNLVHNPEDLLKPTDTVDIWNRLHSGWR